MGMSAALKYPGAKWALAPWIVANLPPHAVYLEPFFGSGAVFFNKPRCRLETINDLDGRVVNLFRALRESPEALARAVYLTPWSAQDHHDCDTDDSITGDAVEDARRFLVKAWQSHGSDIKWRNGWKHAGRTDGSIPAQGWAALPERLMAAAERLRGVQIECRPALEAIARHAGPTCLIYVDPPYPRSTRHRAYYRHEMTDDDHRTLLDTLSIHHGPVVVSGYGCPLYDDRLAAWRRIERTSRAERGQERREVLWLNAQAWRGLATTQQSLPL